MIEKINIQHRGCHKLLCEVCACHFPSMRKRTSVFLCQIAYTNDCIYTQYTHALVDWIKRVFYCIIDDHDAGKFRSMLLYTAGVTLWKLGQYLGFYLLSISLFMLWYVPFRSRVQRRRGVCGLRVSHRRPLPAAREWAFLARDLCQVRRVFKRAHWDLLQPGPPAVLQARLWKVKTHTHKHACSHTDIHTLSVQG